MTKRRPKIPSLDLDDRVVIRFLRVCVERALARDPNDPKALETLAWLNTRRKADPGVFNRRITASIRRLYDAGLSADYILWHQGEGNLGTGDSGGRQYRKNLLEVVASFRTYGLNAPFFVALATRCAKSPHPNAVNVRDGQRTAAIGQLGIFVGPDTDLIGAEHRYDDCHMSESGLALHAAAWADILYGFIKRGGDGTRGR